MKLTAVLLGLFAVVGVAPANDGATEDRVSGLFKNGLCVVKCSFSADQAGEFLGRSRRARCMGRF